MSEIFPAARASYWFLTTNLSDVVRPSFEANCGCGTVRAVYNQPYAMVKTKYSLSTQVTLTWLGEHTGVLQSYMLKFCT